MTIDLPHKPLSHLSRCTFGPATQGHSTKVLTLLPAPTQMPRDSFINDTQAFIAQCCEKEFWNLWEFSSFPIFLSCW